MFLVFLQVVLVAGIVILWAANIYNDISPEEKRKQDKDLSIFK